MQLSELRANLKRLLDEDGVYRPDSVLNNSLNDGYQVASALTQACERTASFTYRIDTGGYCAYLPTDFFLPVAVYIGSSRMEPVRITDLNQLNSGWFNFVAGSPLYYWTLGALSTKPTLWLFPRPSVEVRIKLVYASVPDRLVNDALSPRLPSEYHYILAQYAYAWELLKERGSLLASKAYREFLKFVELVNQLQAIVYRRAPDRDYQMTPWDVEAARRKLFSFDRSQPQPAQTSDAQDLAT